MSKTRSSVGKSAKAETSPRFQRSTAAAVATGAYPKRKSINDSIDQPSGKKQLISTDKPPRILERTAKPAPKEATKKRPTKLKQLNLMEVSKIRTQNKVESKVGHT